MKSKLILKGIGASSGIAEGVAKIVKGIEDAPLFEEGSVLVARITDPSMVLMMGKAAAVICDIGGITSHPAIISREMGIPCIVNAKEATSILKDGDNILVDGNKGEVYLIEQKQE